MTDDPPTQIDPSADEPLIDQYQAWTEDPAGGFATSSTPEVTPERAQQYLILGLTGESGEIAEKVKKAKRAEVTGRDDKDPSAYRREATDELGDLLWYMVRLADELDVTMSDVIEQNYEKLCERQKTWSIVGEGDER